MGRGSTALVIEAQVGNTGKLLPSLTALAASIRGGSAGPGRRWEVPADARREHPERKSPECARLGESTFPKARAHCRLTLPVCFDS